MGWELVDDGGFSRTIAVETESDDGEEELNSANGEVEIKSHEFNLIVEKKKKKAG